MSYPQDKASIIAKYGCLAMCYLYCLGIEDDTEMLRLVSVAMDKGLLDQECTVLDAAKFLENFSGKRFQVTKKDVTYTDLALITEPTPVRYTYRGNGHWVVVQNGKIVFNSLQNSVCVNKGDPVTARIITLRK